jgi:hypothetical protein
MGEKPNMQIHRLKDEPIIVYEPTEDTRKTFDEIQQVLAEAEALKQEMQCRVYRIVDLTNVNLDFSSMMMGMAAETSQAGYRDPDIVTILVASGDLAEFGTKALREQEQYGKADVKLFSTKDEALAFARAEIAAQSSDT